MPTKVVWGAQDRVLPTRQAHRLPGHIAVHVFEGVGHMLPHEIPDAVARLIRENAR
jgi:pyruvate dehydrogenase E2 component (dihydrolipoamide acetyltransferase)